eukprot:7069859-Karenia_brevis.AAC.1
MWSVSFQPVLHAGGHWHHRIHSWHSDGLSQGCLFAPVAGEAFIQGNALHRQAHLGFRVNS